MPLPFYYRLDLSVPPKIKFAVNHRPEKYDLSHSVNPVRCEFVFLQSGTVTELVDGKEFSYTAGDVYTHVHDRSCRKYSLSYPHQHFTVGFHLSSPAIAMTEEEVAQWQLQEDEAIVATKVEDSKVREKLEYLIKKAVRYYETPDNARFLRVKHTLSEIFTLMTEYSIIRARSAQRSSYEKENKYCRRACAYITDHLDEKFSVEDVAAHAGISYGYLSTLFTQTMGQTMVEYINEARIRKAAQLVSVYDMKLEELCRAVGISDTKYLSTLFRRSMGMTIREYKKLHR